MKIKKVLVTGNKAFLYRHQFLFKSMSLYFDNVECLPSGDLHQVRTLDISIRAFYKIIEWVSPITSTRFWISPGTFITRSQQTERKIKQLKYIPDIVFHVFCMFNPFWHNFDIPYVMYLDYTSVLAKKNWIWSHGDPYNDDKKFAFWLECERIAYERSHHIFTMSNIVMNSLIEDYSVKPEKITVVGSSGNCQFYEGEKHFGSKQILFNGSNWERKGGDLVLAAFKEVKKKIPDAKLVIIGKKLAKREDGIDNQGYISSLSEMQNLFLKTDLVVAPARCDPFPTFLMEAMNYGVPCIVSARDGMPEIIDNGINGIVLEQPTPKLLANEIKNLLCDTRRLTYMSHNARHKVKSELNWDLIAKKISQVLSTMT